MLRDDKLKLIHVVTKIIGETLFIYGLLGWIYGMLIQLTHPSWLKLQLSHMTPWLRTDTFTILSFIVSIVGFFVFRLIRNIATTSSTKEI